MNVDWYRPFKRDEYKVAGIFLSVVNLPREERLKVLKAESWCE